MITLDQQIAAVSREIALRERVYPGWIEKGRMTKHKADHEIACMKAALGTLMQARANAPIGGWIDRSKLVGGGSQP